MEVPAMVELAVRVEVQVIAQVVVKVLTKKQIMRAAIVTKQGQKKTKEKGVG